jgi:hypothetical protein
MVGHPIPSKQVESGIEQGKTPKLERKYKENEP